ncbi:MAG TPA: AraC family transcriptional regulator [Euzebyales bacterium]
MLGPAVADYPAAARTGPRVIDDCEFVWMLRGRATYVAGHERVLLVPGRLLLVPPDIRHVLLWDEQGPCRHGYVHFAPTDVAVDVPDVAVVRTPTAHDPLARLCTYLLWLGHERPAGWQTAVRAALRVMVQLVTIGPLPGATAPGALSPVLRSVIGHLRDTWAQPPLRRVTVDEVAAAACVSRSHLSRHFRAELGISPASALERLRCSRAEAMLARTNMTITAIARQCGFADLYHFSHRFRRLHGIAPTVYRSAEPTTSVLDHAGVRRLAYAIWN